MTLKIHENCPRQRNWVTLKNFQRYFSAFSVLSLLPIMSTEIHLNLPKWFFTWLRCKTAQYFFSVIGSLSVWFAKCKDLYLNNKDTFSVWFSVISFVLKFQHNFIDFQCYLDFQCNFQCYNFHCKVIPKLASLERGEAGSKIGIILPVGLSKIL